MAQDEPLDAAASDPKVMGWMQGHPPPAGKVIALAGEDYFAFPKLRWTVCHFRELLPTVGVERDDARPLTFARAIDEGIDTVTFTPLGGGEPMTWKESLPVNYTDGVVVLHRGRIVFERYFGCLDDEGGHLQRHGAMSVTKSLTGLLAEALVAEGEIDETALVSTIVPELEGSAFGDATVEQVLEMTTALDYSEDYSDPDADVWRYAAASSPLPPPEGHDGPRGYFAFLQTVEKEGEHGEAFGYKTVNADALGWIVARASGKSVAELLEERIWSRMGAERNAYFTVDAVGTPFAGGGLSASLRDLARIGQLVLNGGEIGGERLLPKAAIERIRQGGDEQAFAKAGYGEALEGWSYRGMWWVTHNDHGAFAARGVHGQTIYVDPTANMVIARFASHPVAANVANDATSLPAYHAVAEYLMENAEPSLAGPEWVVEDIAGRGVIDNTQASLRFHDDGRLSGNATCNRLIGQYEEGEGGKLAIESPGVTMMACPEALMNQERLLLDVLVEVRSYRFDDTGALILEAGDGTTITARRR